ncbi:MAG: DUF4861 family protein [Bacteroidales bacterium]|nr:DUF4861 family protein [Bacteroidales bacterium]
MKKVALFLTVSALILSSCCRTTVTVCNPTDADRLPEMVELNLDSVHSALSLEEGEAFVIRDQAGEEAPYQITHDRKVIFQVRLKGNETVAYSIRKGTPSVYETIVCGRQYPERVDDFAWENDLVGFRAYGPALQKKGEKGYGYDLFAKRGTHLPVLEKFYELALGERTAGRYEELLRKNPQEAEDYKLDTMNFHIDHGYGMDVYAVGPNLGAGVTALVDGDIIYPWCYKDYEILDNGPLRISFRLTFAPIAAGQDTDVIESRVITLDAGSHLNRTYVTYENLTQPKELVAGIVLRDKDGKEVTDIQKGYMAYPAPSMNFDKRYPDLDNGTHFVGHVYPDRMKDMKTVFHSEKEMREERGGAPGHLLAYTEYEPGESFLYYWGFGWDHSDIRNYEEWISYLETFSKQLKQPLIIKIN